MRKNLIMLGKIEQFTKLREYLAMKQQVSNVYYYNNKLSYRFSIGILLEPHYTE